MKLVFFVIDFSAKISWSVFLSPANNFLEVEPTLCTFVKIPIVNIMSWKKLN